MVSGCGGQEREEGRVVALYGGSDRIARVGVERLFRSTGLLKARARRGATGRAGGDLRSADVTTCDS